MSSSEVYFLLLIQEICLLRERMIEADAKGKALVGNYYEKSVKRKMVECYRVLKRFVEENPNLRDEVYTKDPEREIREIIERAKKRRGAGFDCMEFVEDISSEIAKEICPVEEGVKTRLEGLHEMEKEDLIDIIERQYSFPRFIKERVACFEKRM